MNINAIERVLDKRAGKGATDESLIAMLNHLKTVHKLPHHIKSLNSLIDAIKQTPSKNTYTKAQMEYIDSVSGEAHQSAVEIIGRLDKAKEHPMQNRSKQCLKNDWTVKVNPQSTTIRWCDKTIATISHRWTKPSEALVNAQYIAKACNEQ